MKSGGLLVDILLIALMAAVFLLGFVNMAAFETALGVLLVTAGDGQFKGGEAFSWVS